MITINVNGTDYQLDVEPDTPLLWAVRDELNMTGSKFGCGAGLCGACTMHLDGQPIRTCVFPIIGAAGRKITTIEGIANGEQLSPVQEAWVELNVPQCGYCQSGQIMSATALLNSNPKPSDADIDAAMSGNICRCGTYPRIRKAIHLAAEKMQQGQNVSASGVQFYDAQAQGETQNG